jgi:hypothetical protein
MAALHMKPEFRYRSAVIQYAEPGTILTVFDSPTGSKEDDYTIIKIRNKITDPVSVKALLMVYLHKKLKFCCVMLCNVARQCKDFFQSCRAMSSDVARKDFMFRVNAG